MLLQLSCVNRFILLQCKRKIIMEHKKSKESCHCCCNHGKEASHHGEGSEAKEQIIKIAVSAVLLVVAMVVEKFFH